MTLRVIHPQIKRTENDSDSNTERTRVYLNNGYEVSVIKGKGTNGGWADAYEIAIINPNGKWAKFDFGDTVLGWLYQEDVDKWIDRVSRLPKGSYTPNFEV